MPVTGASASCASAARRASTITFRNPIQHRIKACCGLRCHWARRGHFGRSELIRWAPDRFTCRLQAPTRWRAHENISAAASVLVLLECAPLVRRHGTFWESDPIMAGRFGVAQYRQGDILLEETDDLPAGLAGLPAASITESPIALASGARHSHTLMPGPHLLALCLPENRSGMPDYLVIGPAGARLLHDEHAPIDLPPGRYRVIRQREYDPIAAGTRLVCD